MLIFFLKNILQINKYALYMHMILLNIPTN